MSVLPSRLHTSSCHFSSASSVATFSSDPIGVGCSTFWNFADVGACVRTDAQAVGREEERLGLRRVPFRLVAADYNVEEMAAWNGCEREVDRLAPLRADDAESPPLVLQPHEHVVESFAAGEL